MRMRQVTGNHAADVTRILQGLVSKGALVQEGKTRGTRYKLPEQIDSLHREDDSLHKEGHFPRRNVHSIHTDANLKTESTTVADLDAALFEISAPARKNKRLPPKEMEQQKHVARGRLL